HDAGVEREEEHAEGAERGVEADQEGGIGEVEDQPPEGHRLHPGAHQGGPLAQEEELEVAVGERAETEAESAFGHCGKARHPLKFGVGRCATRPIRSTCPSWPTPSTSKACSTSWRIFSSSPASRAASNRTGATSRTISPTARSTPCGRPSCRP